MKVIRTSKSKCRETFRDDINDGGDLLFGTLELIVALFAMPA